METKAANEIIHGLHVRKCRVILKQSPNSSRRNNLHLPQVSVTGILGGFVELAQRFRDYVKTNNVPAAHVTGIVYSGGDKVGTLTVGVDTEGEDGYNVILLQAGTDDLITDEATKRRKLIEDDKKKAELRAKLLPNYLAQWSLWERILLKVRDEIAKRSESIRCNRLNDFLTDAESVQNTPVGTDIRTTPDNIYIYAGGDEYSYVLQVVIKIENYYDWESSYTIKVSTVGTDFEPEGYFAATDAAREFTKEMRLFLESIKEEVTAVRKEYGAFWESC